MKLGEMLEKRRQECAAILVTLLDKPALDYDQDLICSTNTVPTTGGLYLFSQKGAPLGEYLYAGKSKDLRNCSRKAVQPKTLLRAYPRSGWQCRSRCRLVAASDCDETVMKPCPKRFSADQNASTQRICKRLKNQLEYNRAENFYHLSDCPLCSSKPGDYSHSKSKRINEKQKQSDRATNNSSSTRAMLSTPA